MTAKILLGIFALATWLVPVGSVCAQVNEADRATARVLAAEGNEALTRKDFVTAEDRFRRADTLVHAPSLVLDHARALVGLGRFAEAYRRYSLVLQERLPEGAPAAWKRAVKEAEQEIQSVRPRVGWLTLRISGAPDPHVWLDGRELSEDDLRSTIPVDPGRRSVSVRAPGFKSSEGEITVREGAESELAVTLNPLPTEAPPPPEPRVVVAPPAPAPPAKNKVLAYTSLGIGAAGLVAGTVTGVLFLGVLSDIKSECPDLHCEYGGADRVAHHEQQERRYKLLGTLSGASFIVGIAGATVGTVLLVSSGSHKTEKASVSAYVGAGALGLAGRF
ncbi:MAG TPA: hypothetical protein VFQ61_08450 [Polyangiaceae bacterium]|nr:hypothetical protein [Polyangiaceae bacterium]